MCTSCMPFVSMCIVFQDCERIFAYLHICEWLLPSCCSHIVSICIMWNKSCLCFGGWKASLTSLLASTRIPLASAFCLFLQPASKNASMLFNQFSHHIMLPRLDSNQYHILSFSSTGEQKLAFSHEQVMCCLRTLLPWYEGHHEQWLGIHSICV